MASDYRYTDGAEVLYNYGQRQEEAKLTELVVVRNQQRVFVPIVEQYLRHIQYGADHWAERLELPGYTQTRVIVDLKRAFGRPIVERGSVPVDELVDRWWAGDSIRVIAEDFGLLEDEVEDVIRAATRTSAAA